MTLILDPANTDDTAAYERIKDNVGLASTVTAAAINGHTLFEIAETRIVTLLPNVALTVVGASTGRNYPQRTQVITALVCCTTANFIRGGGNTAGNFSTTQASGSVRSKSQTIGSVTERVDYDVGSRSNSQGVESPDDRADFFDEQCNAILKSLGAKIEDDTLDFAVLLTESRL